MQLRGFELASLETQLRGFDANIEASTRSLNSIREQVNVLNNRRGEASSLAAQLEAAKTQHQKSSEALARKKQLPVRTPSWETAKANDFIAALTQKDLDLQNTGLTCRSYDAFLLI